MGNLAQSGMQSHPSWKIRPTDSGVGRLAHAIPQCNSEIRIGGILSLLRDFDEVIRQGLSCVSEFENSNLNVHEHP